MSLPNRPLAKQLPACAPKLRGRRQFPTTMWRPVACTEEGGAQAKREEGSGGKYNTRRSARGPDMFSARRRATPDSATGIYYVAQRLALDPGQVGM